MLGLPIVVPFVNCTQVFVNGVPTFIGGAVVFTVTKTLSVATQPVCGLVTVST